MYDIDDEMNEMIRIQGLTKDYGAFRAVDGIDITINRGEIVGLLGPNGAGKTSTLRMLTCYLRPTAGTITVGQHNIAEHPLEVKNMMGYLPESAPLYPEMLVYDYLRFVSSIRGIANPDARIRELAGICGLMEVMHKAVGELSKGYKQRVGLAHAMMSDPEILVLDEPTSGLDPNQIVEIRQLIRMLGRQKTVILSTHILSEAEATCDRIIIIDRGRIVADGATKDLTGEAAGDSYVVEVTLANAGLDEATEVLGKVAGVTGVADAPVAGGQSEGLRLDITCRADEDVRPALYAAIKGRDWVILEFRRRARTLESTFRELTRGEHAS